MYKLTEKKIENGLAKYYQNSDFIVKKQVYLSQKRVDILAKQKDCNEIYAIEVKIHDWQTAIRQANLNRVYCNKSYIAIWHQFAHRAISNLDSFIQLGLGLVVVDSDFKPHLIYDPSAHNEINPIAQNYILNKL